MFRAHACAVLGIGLMLAVAEAHAGEVELSVESRMGGDSNVLRTSTEKREDGFFALAPRLAVREERKTLNYDFTYNPTYQVYFDTSGINGVDHRATGAVAWYPTPTDSITINSKFSSIRQLVLSENPTSSNPTPAIEPSDRQRTQRAEAQLSYDRKLNSLWSIQVGAALDDIDYTKQSGLVDSRSFSGRLGTRYVWDSRTTLGTFGLYRRRENRGLDSEFQGSATTDVFNIGASVEHHLSPTLFVTLSGGPSFIETKTKQKNPFPFGPPDLKETSESTSYFAVARITKRWRRSDATASYTRSESGTGGTVRSSIADSVRLDVHHRFTRRWNIHLVGIWNQRKEISADRNLEDGDSTDYLALVSLRRELTRRFSVIGRYMFQDHERDGRFREGSIGSVHIGTLSLRYVFEPYRY
jgi:hypothetical protein